MKTFVTSQATEIFSR